jgi:hypothetical protein
MRPTALQGNLRPDQPQRRPQAALDPSVITSRRRRPSRPRRNRPCKKAVQLVSLSPRANW